MTQVDIWVSEALQDLPPFSPLEVIANAIVVVVVVVPNGVPNSECSGGTSNHHVEVRKTGVGYVLKCNVDKSRRLNSLGAGRQ